MREAPLAALVRDRALDAELAALLWLLVEARVPAVVAGPSRPTATVVRDALAGLLPDGAAIRRLDGEHEDFAWMPEAVELGWRRERGREAARSAGTPAGETTLEADLDDGPGGTWSERARIAIRALAVGYTMLATTAGSRLEDVYRQLGDPPVSATHDELARLGTVLVLSHDGARVSAAHYLRPVARDEHGHVQRMAPAVLAAWDPATDRFEHFSWGLTAELTDRTGLKPVELEREQARRAEHLAAMASKPGV